MMYEPKNYENLIGIDGLSEQLLKNHFTLYQGYVSNVNKIIEAGAPDRRLGWEWDGMRLHEYYFENLAKGGSGLDKDSDLYKKLIVRWGSYEAWEKDFKAVGAMRGIGWVILYRDDKTGKLFNVWINEHDAGHLAGATPILAMDVFEHAYMLDYGIKKADYIETFFKNINWAVASARLKV